MHLAVHCGLGSPRDRFLVLSHCSKMQTLICVQVCYYRDKNSINKFQKATVTAEGVKISDAFALDTKWNYKVGHAAYARL